MEKHTPGPYLRDGRTVYALTQYRIRTGHVVETSRVWANVCPGHECSQEEAEAVAVLFQASPDLLEELKQANSQMEMAAEAIEAGRYDEALLHVRAMSGRRCAAIAKATGDA